MNFKVGDYIKIKKTYHGHSYYQGQTVCITSFYEDEPMYWGKCCKDGVVYNTQDINGNSFAVKNCEIEESNRVEFKIHDYSKFEYAGRERMRKLYLR